MVDLECCLPEKLDEADTQLIDEVMGSLTSHFRTIREFPLVSLQYHCFDGPSAPPHDLVRHVVLGAPVLTEKLCDCFFDLSPTAFFQVNLAATEDMLRRVREEAQLDAEKTVLLDLCCGTGSIGITLARSVQQVIGVELVADAIENAKQKIGRAWCRERV